MAFTQSINIQAADEASMQSLLLGHGLLTAAGSGWSAAAGTVISTHGRARLANGTAVAGYFATVMIDTDVVPNGDAVWAALNATGVKWEGEPIEYVLGVGVHESTTAKRALNYAHRRMDEGGFRIQGETPIRWFPFLLVDGYQDLRTRDAMQYLASLADDAAVAAEGIRIKPLNRARETISTKARASAILAAAFQAELRWAKSLGSLQEAIEADPTYNWRTHNYPAGFGF